MDDSATSPPPSPDNWTPPAEPKPKTPRKPRPSEIAAKAAKRAKMLEKVKKTKPKSAKKLVRKIKKAAKRKPAASGSRSERLDFRVTKAEKAKLVAKAKASRRTITSILLELIEKMK